MTPQYALSESMVSMSEGRVHINMEAMRAIMKSEAAQQAVTDAANKICERACSLVPDKKKNTPPKFVVHPRVLSVSAHAFVDCASQYARNYQAKHNVLEKAFSESIGG